MANTYNLISSNVLGSSAATVTFSSIPATFTDLVVRASTRGDNSGLRTETVIIQFNSDTNTNYSSINLFGNATTPQSSTTSSATQVNMIRVGNGSTATASTFGNWEVYFPFYLSTVNKPFSYAGAPESDVTTTGMFETPVGASLYRGTSAISSIILKPFSSTNFVSGSSFYLYGIKNS